MEPVPTLYELGLRPARCNGCRLAELRHELGNKLLVRLTEDGWTEVYELDAEPLPGQGEPQEVDGRPVRWHVTFMSTEHSDECYQAAYAAWLKAERERPLTRKEATDVLFGDW